MLHLHDFKKSRSRSPSPVRSNDDRRVESFFDSLIPEEYRGRAEISFILVCHMAPTLFPYLNAIKKIGNIALIIPKGFQRDSAQKVIERLEAEKEKIGYRFFLKPEDFSNSNEIKEKVKANGIELIREHTRGRFRSRSNKFIIIDIGGYFSEFFEQITLNDNVEDLRSNLIGIVEDTENGHQKYSNSIEKLKRELAKHPEQIEPSQMQVLNRLYSVARCDLKNTEDYNVGKSIVEASGTIIRIDAHVILERMAIAGVIGFGKIGRSIAEHLRQKNLREVVVYDADILRQMEASSLGFKVVSRPYLIRNAQIIFSATGSRCLKAEDVMYMQDNVFIASCTSDEDELDFSFRTLLKQEEGRKKHGDVYKIKIGQKSINLLDDGNAVNFVHGAVNGPYIYSVQGGLIACAIRLIDGGQEEKIGLEKLPNMKLKELSKGEMRHIAEKWLNVFDGCDSHVDFHLETYLLSKRKYSRPNPVDSVQDVVRYLEQNGYFDSPELKLIVTETVNIFTHNDISKINRVADQIRGFLRYGMFSGLLGYISSVLIKFIENTEGYEDERIKLLLLRATADLFLSVNGKESWEQLGLKDVLEDSFLVLHSKVEFLSDKIDLEDKKSLLEFLSTFLEVIDSFEREGVKLKIGIQWVEGVRPTVGEWARQAQESNRL